MKFDTCKSCGATIAWLPTASNKPMPVDAATYAAGDTRFDPARHVSHFATCPHGKRWRKPKEQAALFPEGETS